MSLGWGRISTSIRIQEFQAAGPLLRSPNPTSSCTTAILFKLTLTVSPMFSGIIRWDFFRWSCHRNQIKRQLASDSQHDSFEGSSPHTDRSNVHHMWLDLFVWCCNFTHWFISTVRLLYLLYLGSEKNQQHYSTTVFTYLQSSNHVLPDFMNTLERFWSIKVTQNTWLFVLVFFKQAVEI